MAGWYFLAAVIVMYIVSFFINKDVVISGLKYAVGIFEKVIPIFVLVYILLVLINYFIRPQQLAKHLGEGSGIKGWIIAVVAGILSSGPIYMWYPLLNELQKHGVRNGLIATFLYNRAVKPALLPLIIYYFGLKFTIVLTIVMVGISIVQGMIIDKFVGVKS
ncbi:MAG: hypothetical protein J7K73_00885 [Nanoarchaeota archaeon]|nr:hypothetical protein [Nanoarchaeota archaeon]